jgi:hypothetical protein
MQEEVTMGTRSKSQRSEGETLIGRLEREYAEKCTEAQKVKQSLVQKLEQQVATVAHTLAQAIGFAVSPVWNVERDSVQLECTTTFLDRPFMVLVACHVDWQTGSVKSRVCSEGPIGYFQTTDKLLEIVERMLRGRAEALSLSRS